MDTDTKHKLALQLRKHGYRMSSLKEQIFLVLQTAGKPLSIQQITKLIPEHHFVSIYRASEAMYKSSVISPVHKGYKKFFELGDNFMSHHHHATCEVCGVSTPVNDRKLENLMRALSKEVGLKPTRHTFELFGICVRCLSSTETRLHQNPKNRQ